MADTATIPLKRRLIQALETLPDDATFDDAVECLLFVHRVETGLAEAEQAMLMPHEQVKRTWRAWAR